MKSSKKRIVDILKMLSLDMLNKAGNDNAIPSLQNANLFYSMYSGGLIYNMDKPTWINRDRFIMANEKCLPIYYATKYMAGLDIELNDLKKLNKLNSKTQMRTDTGKENGIAYAVGVALAEQYYEKMLNAKGNDIINYNTYVFCNIDDLKKGASHEALTIAKSHNLTKLVIICDTNDTKDSDVDSLIDYYNFKIIKANSNNIGALNNVFDKTHDEKKPIIVLLKGSIEKEEQGIIKNNKINEETLNKLRNEYEVCSEPFEVLKDDMTFFKEVIKKHSKDEYESWLKDYANFKKIATKEQMDILNFLEGTTEEIAFDSDKYKVNATYAEKLNKTNNSIINILAKKYLNFISCSTNFSQTLTNIESSKSCLGKKNIELKNCEMAFSQIASGIASENIITVASTTLTNAPKLIDGIKLSIAQNTPTIYEFTQDSVFNSNELEQPIYEENLLRMIPNLIVFRPCDINEIFGCYEYAIKNKKPICIIIGNKAAIKYENTNPKFVQYGAYMIRKETEKLDAVLISSGAEIQKALDIADSLSKEKIEIRVVSMPSTNLFEIQKENYEKLLLPKKVPVIVLEPSNSLIWNRFATDKNHIISINEYNYGGEKEKLEEIYKYTNDDIISRIKDLL